MDLRQSSSIQWGVAVTRSTGNSTHNILTLFRVNHAMRIIGLEKGSHSIHRFKSLMRGLDIRPTSRNLSNLQECVGWKYKE